MANRRSSSRRSTSVIATLITLVLVAIVYAFQSFQAAPAPVVETPPAGQSWYQLYFSDPDVTAKLDNPSGGPPSAIAASFAKAQQTIDVAVYEIDLPIYAEALIAAQQRGVRVRVVTDSDYLKEKATQTILQAGIPVVGDDREPFMHNKFAVIDGAQVWTGSLNFTFNDAYRNNNSTMLINSTRLAQNYTAQFERMFTDRNFSEAVTAPNPTLNISGTLIENYFSPRAGVAEHILDVLKTAQTSIYFMAFSFTRDDFTNALIERSKAGVTVQGVFERRQVEAGADYAWNALRKAGLDVLEDGNPYNLHSKVFIVDKQIVVMGSYNFSRNAEESNDENVLIIHNADIAAAYFAEWQKVWDKASQ